MTKLRARAATACLGLAIGALAPSLAQAQMEPLPPPPIGELAIGGADLSGSLIPLRLGHVEERRREGLGLTLWGGAAILGGALVAIIGREDRTLVAFGVTTISFGAINLPLGLGLMDLRHRYRDEALALTAAGAEEVAAQLDLWQRAERGKRASFAVNAALDVIYMLAGALMIGLAERTRHPDSNRGAGWGMISQGLGLLIFDVYGVIATSRRLRELRRASPFSGAI